MIKALNLIPTYRREAMRCKGRTQRWVVGTLGYALFLLGLWSATVMLWGRGDHAVTSELAEVRAQIEQSRGALKQITPHLAEVQTTLAASRSIGDQPDWSVLLGLLADLLGPKNVMVSFQLEPISPTLPGGIDVAPSIGTPNPSTGGAVDTYRLALKGLGQSQAAVQAYVLRLEQTELFERVALLDTRKEPFLDGQAVAFRIDCTLLANPTPRSTQMGAASTSTLGSLP